MESAGALLGIIDIASRLGLRLARFLQEVREAKETSNGLLKQAATFRNVLSCVEKTLRNGGAYSQTNFSNNEGLELRQLMKDALDHCKVTVTRFEKRLRSLGRDTDPEWIKNFAYTWRSQAQASGLARSEADMKSDIAWLHLLLTCFSP